MKKIIIGKIIATLLLIILAVGLCLLFCIDITFIGNLSKLAICLIFSVFPAGGILMIWVCGK